MREIHPIRRLLITAGPTHEPIDEVRYIGNRSSGRLGVALADAGAGRGVETTLLLGPTSLGCSDTRVRTIRFRTAADLEALLGEHLGWCDALVMAAAVADYRPIRRDVGGKLRREKTNLTIECEPTPDLLAGCAARRREGQTLVGFALEPRERLERSAREKLERKGIDAIVANPLETMEGERIEAWLIRRDGEEARTEGAIPKEAFAGWLLDRLGVVSG